MFDHDRRQDRSPKLLTEADQLKREGWPQNLPNFTPDPAADPIKKPPIRYKAGSTF